jgi:NADH-quinone oxidoreductase subunit E
LTPENVQRARAVIARYPQPRSACIPLLHLAQEQDGSLEDDAMAHIAELLDVAPAEVLGTASFYEMFKRHHVGRHLIGICTNISCLLNGADELVAHAERTLGVPVGGTTDDGAFTLEGMECLAACGGAPCLQVNYRYAERVTPAAFDELVAALRAGRTPDMVQGDAVPPHGTLSRVTPPQPQTDNARVKPEEIRS